jgi:hypothetical protein
MVVSLSGISISSKPVTGVEIVVDPPFIVATQAADSRFSEVSMICRKHRKAVLQET